MTRHEHEQDEAGRGEQHELVGPEEGRSSWSSTPRPSPRANPRVVATTCPPISQTVANPSQRCSQASRSGPTTWSRNGLRDMRTSWTSAAYVPSRAVELSRRGQEARRRAELGRAAVADPHEDDEDGEPDGERPEVARPERPSTREGECPRERWRRPVRRGPRGSRRRDRSACGRRGWMASSIAAFLVRAGPGRPGGRRSWRRCLKRA